MSLSVPRPEVIHEVTVPLHADPFEAQAVELLRTLTTDMCARILEEYYRGRDGVCQQVVRGEESVRRVLAGKFRSFHLYLERSIPH